ncbi:MAG: nuclear transport factor 2 family protein [Acidobacteriota bacterium]
MNIAKSLSNPCDSRKRPNTGRRSFIWKTGAAMSAVVASAAAGFSKPDSTPDTGLKNQVGMLEDANSIRRLHQIYASRLDRGLYEEAVDMFTEDGEVAFNGGLFKGKDRGVRRLFCVLFKSGLTGKKIEPAPGFEPDPEQQQDIVEVAADRKSACGKFSYSMQVGTPMSEDSSLVHMARLQGEGILKWWEGGVHEASYVKVGDSWKIRSLEYRVLSKANYKPGRAHARPMDVPVFSATYPADPNGPDQLL